MRPILGKLHTLKPNRLEAELLSGGGYPRSPSARQAAGKLLETGLQRVFISWAPRGSLPPTTPRTCGTPAARPRCAAPPGRGDAFAAALAWAFLEGKDLAYSARAANAAAAIAVEGEKDHQPRPVRRGGPGADDRTGGSTMNPYLDVNPAVAQALAEGKPVVALESTIISHGMPYPQNVETALKVEEIIRQNGAVPCHHRHPGGRLKAGLSPAEIEYLGKQGQKVTKASRRDLSVLVAQGADGATTVATTMMIAHMAGIKLFATGGIGGGPPGGGDHHGHLRRPGGAGSDRRDGGLRRGQGHPGPEAHPGIPGDQGVPVLGYQTQELPAFYTRTSGLKVDYQVDSPEMLAKILKTQHDLGLHGGILVTNPIPEQYSMDADAINAVIDQAIAEAQEKGIHGKRPPPFLLAKVKEITGETVWRPTSSWCSTMPSWPPRPPWPTPSCKPRRS